MPEYYKRVVCSQFNPTQEQRDKIVKGETIEFDGQPIKHLGGHRFLVLIPIGDRPTPVGETQWIVNNNPGIEIYNDNDFRAKFVDPQTIATKNNQK